MLPSRLRRTGLELFLISFGVLSLELCVIRWLPGQVRVAAYFPNLVLIAAFLGLGVGALSKSGGHRRMLAAGAALMLAAIVLGKVAIHSGTVSDHLWLLYYDLPEDAPRINGLVLPLSLLFTLTALLFVPLGHAIGQRLDQFKRGDKPLIGYAVDLAGSLSGTLAFLALTALRLPPLAWFILAGAALLPLWSYQPKRLLSWAVAILLCAATVHHYDRAERYSPYYGVTVEPVVNVVNILTNGSLHQVAFDPRAEPPAEDPTSPLWGYRLPVSNLQPQPQRALVLGAGSGNDVAMLLHAGVPEVHAVEIDPLIIDIGRDLHPASPYQDPRVVLHNTDARAFLERTDLQFDLIVFGTLDSMTKLSAHSQVRLDNFVYTVECIQAAKACLTPQGGMALLFMCGSDNLVLRLNAMITQAWGEAPAVHLKNYSLFNTMFLIGRGFDHLMGDPDWRPTPAMLFSQNMETATDDWPFIYLDGRTFPLLYLEVAAAIIVVTFVMLLTVSGRMRRDLLAGRIDGEMVGFGAAFLLLETAFVTQLSLLFGTTWIASGIVFAAVLAALLAATLIRHRWKISARLALVVVIICLTVAGTVPLLSFAPSSLLGRVAFSLIYCGLPVLGAGLAFAARFQQRDDIESAFGWNILGAVFGGLLELLSMLTGLRAVFLIAAALYAIVLLLGSKRSGSVTGTAAI